nr:hypothetical protein [Bartonella tribocorum]
MNDDLTEYGRKETYDNSAKAYKSLGVFVYGGLSNHDYANNVHDYTIPQRIQFFPPMPV